MHYRYTVREEAISCEGARHTAYGILAVCDDGSILAHLPSLFAERTEAEAFAALANRLCLSPCHLFEVAEDILAK